MASNMTAHSARIRSSEMDGWLQPQTRPIVIYLFMWTTIAIVAATTTFIALGNTTLGQWMAIAYKMFAYFYAWSVFSLLIYWMITRLRFSIRSWFAIVLGHFGLLVVIAIVLPFLVSPGNWQSLLYGTSAIGFQALNASIYSFVLIGSLMLRYYRIGLAREQDAQKQSLRASRLENDLNRARIDTLKMQINPHFLFNALNSIAALIETTRNPEAYRMTELLGGLLRSALDQSSEKTISLRAELEFLGQYIEIEKIRFGGKLQFDSDVPEDCLDRPIPTLLLQPIVENSIKHAVMPSAHTVTISLSVSCKTNRLEISVCDDGPGLSGSSHSGHGLPNVRQRLQLLYGDAARFTVRNIDSGGVCAMIDVPAVVPDSVG